MKFILRIKKIGVVAILAGIFTFAGIGSVSASTLIGGDVGTNYIPYDGYEYDMSSKNTYTDLTWRHYHSNTGSTTDTVTHAVSRTASTSASVSASASFNVMVTEVGIDAEVGWNSTDTVETSVTYSIPGYSNYELQYGNRAVKTSGYELRYSRGFLVERNYVTGDWTYMGYSTKVKK